MELTDRTAVITGASSGIGRATATALAEAGCAVTLAARREEKLVELAEELDTAETVLAPTDVTDASAVQEMISETVAAFGGIDLVVNSAGILRPATVEDAGLSDLHRQIEVNLQGVINTTHAALPPLLDSSLGDIVTVSSMNARHPVEGGSAYTASKFGVNGFCRSVRKELSEEDVRVTIVMPGPVKTEMRQWSDWSGQPLDPSDVADTIMHIVSRPRRVELGQVIVNSTDKL